MRLPFLPGGRARPLHIVRTCRLCGCTDARACPGGCAWAFDDVCTACIGHTPTSWAAVEAGRDFVLAQRPALVCLVSAAHYATLAAEQILDNASQHAPAQVDAVVTGALRDLLLAAEELIEAGGARPEHGRIGAAITEFLERDR